MAKTVVDKENNIKKFQSTETLKVKLTDEEVLRYGDELARAIDEHASLENEFQGFKDSFKGKMTTVDAKINTLKNLVRDKCDYRKVDVEEVFDNIAGMVRKFRLDTNELIEERKMTAEERQSKLFDVEP